MQIDDKTNFLADVYRAQLLRHIKGLPEWSKRQLLEMGLIQSIETPIWCKLPNG
jgi:hypothetical protein